MKHRLGCLMPDVPQKSKCYSCRVKQFKLGFSLWEYSVLVSIPAMVAAFFF